VNELLFPPHFFKDFRYADGSLNPPSYSATVKQEPQDFLVTEELGFDLEGAGEHFWLFVEKTQRHTTDAAKQLAKTYGLHERDIGFSGMKDHQAVTRQWFSLWMPKICNQNKTL